MCIDLCVTEVHRLRTAQLLCLLQYLGEEREALTEPTWWQVGLAQQLMI